MKLRELAKKLIFFTVVAFATSSVLVACGEAPAEEGAEGEDEVGSPFQPPREPGAVPTPAPGVGPAVQGPINASTRPTKTQSGYKFQASAGVVTDRSVGTTSGGYTFYSNTQGVIISDDAD